MINTQEILDRNKKKLAKIDQINKVWASVSEINSYLGCQRKWALDVKYPTPKRGNLVLGSAFHAALEEYYNYTPDTVGTYEELRAEQLWACQEVAKKFVDASLEEAPELAGELLGQEELLNTMIETYVSFAEQNDNFNVIATELLIIEEIMPGIFFKAFLDGLAVDKDGKFWILEHKTAKAVSQVHLPYDLQISAYIAVTEKHLEIPIEGVIYNQAKKKIPSTPKFLKDGTVSMAACDTTVAKFTKALEVAFLSKGEEIPDKYKSKVAELMETEKEFMMRTVWKRTTEEKQSTIEFLSKIIKEIKWMREQPIEACYPNPSKDCDWKCDNKHLCLMLNRKEKLPEPIKKTDNGKIMITFEADDTEE